MVAASTANTIIVLHPDTTTNQETAEASKAAVAMALSVTGGCWSSGSRSTQDAIITA